MLACFNLALGFQGTYFLEEAKAYKPAVSCDIGLARTQERDLG